MPKKIGVIGGYSLSGFMDQYKKVRGSFSYMMGKSSEKEVFLIPRHGEHHEYPPHKVPLIEYFDFLKSRGVKDLLTIYSVGVLHKNWKVPCIVIIDDFIDFTGELATIHDRFNGRPIHVSMEEPYHEPYKKILLKAAENDGCMKIYRGIYFQTIGPRLETRAEIRAARKLGGDVVGMTHSWEAILAKEYGFNLVSLGLGVNHASGVVKKEPLSDIEIIANSEKSSKELTGLIKYFIKEI